MAGVRKPKIIKTKAIVDIVFCLDCTNGGAVARYMESQIIRFVESLNSKEGDVVADWRARIVGYGDLDEGEEIQNSNAFVCDAASIVKQLSALELYAGGDELESTLDAICYAAKQSDWRDKCFKFVFVLTDAHTKELYFSTKINYYINNVEELMHELYNNHIKLFLWGPKDPVYESFKALPKSEIILLDDANGALYSGKIDLTEYLDRILAVRGYDPFWESNFNK